MDVNHSGHGETSVGKYISAGTGTILSETYLKTHFPQLTFLGSVQRTGLLGIDKTTGDIVTFVRHPSWVPILSVEKGTVYGGKQTPEHITYLLAKQFREEAISLATQIIAAIKAGEQPPYHALTIGKEIESVAVNPLNGALEELPKEDQFEFQRCLYEEALLPYASLEESIIGRCCQIFYRKKKFPKFLLLDTSVPLTGSPNDHGMQLNNGALESYVKPWISRSQKNLTEHDKDAVHVINTVAQHAGYDDYKDMMQQKGYSTTGPTFANHTSYGMAHIEQDDGYRIPLEHAIAVSDIFNSDMGVIAELLMVSSPCLFGDVIKLRGQWPRDYRMILRYLITGTWPAPPIRSVEKLYTNWTYATLSGLLFTVDRMSYLAKLPQRPVHAMFYGSARIRVEVKDFGQMFGRVENTLAGSSPSLLDEIAHDSFLYLCAVAALEAVAHSQTPMDYYGGRYPHIASWRKRKTLSREFNFHGANSKNVTALIDEMLRFLAELDEQYPPLHSMITFTRLRIENLRRKPAVSLEHYAEHPDGPISEVMQQMLSHSASPLQLSKELEYYQYALAQKIATLGTKDLFAKLIAVTE